MRFLKRQRHSCTIPSVPSNVENCKEGEVLESEVMMRMMIITQMNWHIVCNC